MHRIMGKVGNLQRIKNMLLFPPSQEIICIMQRFTSYAIYSVHIIKKSVHMHRIMERLVICKESRICYYFHRAKKLYVSCRDLEVMLSIPYGLSRNLYVFSTDLQQFLCFQHIILYIFQSWYISCMDSQKTVCLIHRSKQIACSRDSQTGKLCFFARIHEMLCVFRTDRQTTYVSCKGSQQIVYFLRAFTTNVRCIQ